MISESEEEFIEEYHEEENVGEEND